MVNISVVIPVYHAVKFLRLTLDSVFLQTRRPDEIVIVDDASTDRTAELARSTAASAPVPIRFEVLPQNSGGPSAPTNRGLELTKGDFIALLDHDDLMLPNKLEQQAAVLESQPEVDFVLSDYQHIGPEGVLPDSDARHWEPEGHRKLFAGFEVGKGLLSPTLSSRGGEGDELYIFDPLTCLKAFVKRPGLALSCSSYFFRKSLYERIGGLNHHYMPVADFDFLLRAVDRPVAWLDRVLFYKRVHDTNHWRTFVAEPSRKWRSERSSARAQRAMLKRVKADAELRALVANHTGYVAAGFLGVRDYRSAFAEASHLLALRQPWHALRVSSWIAKAAIRANS
jgi:glycosyltransferase involved in cell wall biosynthesis